MHRAGGYLEVRRDGVLTAEFDTFTCAHCNTTVVLRAGADPTSKGAIVAPQPHWQSDGMGVCLQCCGKFERGLICPRCEAEQHRIGRCVNFEKRLLMSERRQLMIGAILRE